MPDNNSNIIKPVETLHNIARLAPTRQREQRKRRQDLQEQNKEKENQQNNEQISQQNLDQNPADGKNGTNTIDYCA
jgi:hypothetical protein